MPTSIRVRNLSKSYRLGDHVGGYGRLTETLAGALKRPFRRSARERDEILWALDDVSLDIPTGEVVGLVGANGAGKSTLLKILTRITEPTKGSAVIAGRVGSLLEVGTGFHPELTGRENVYLNGAILGLTRNEIKERFEEIVEFAELARFIDTPVKRYSSGMYVRLAFSVAAHLESDVLLVDEVLAVGDAAFQKKSLGRVGQVRSQGRTVILVSHNMAAITSICDRGILLEKGRVVADGPVSQVATQYQSSLGSMRSSFVWLEDWSNRYGPRKVSRLLSIELRDQGDAPTSAVPMGEGIKVLIGARFSGSVRVPEVGFKIISPTGVILTHIVAGWEDPATKLDAGDYIFTVDVPDLRYVPGYYGLSPWIKTGNPSHGADDGIDGALEFQILPGQIQDRSPIVDLYSQPGETHVSSRWTFARSPEPLVPSTDD
jgi:lipopolysaccharide transport system ATP-binding protein